MHFFANIWPTQEVACWDDAEEETNQPMTLENILSASPEVAKFLKETLIFLEHLCKW